MKLGEKIRQARQNAGMTQTELAGDFITRNMLSQIENGLAMPSLQTAMYIADRLGVDAGLLLSENDDAGVYFVTRKLPEAKKLYASGEYDGCIELCLREGEDCDEANLLVAECYVKKAYACYGNGKLRNALKALESGAKYGKRTVYSTDGLKLKAEMLEVIISSVTPYLKQTGHKPEEKEFLIRRFVEERRLTGFVSKQKEISRFMDGGRYAEALAGLKDMLKERDMDVPITYSVYCNIEICCRELGDYENAYKFSQKAKKLFEDMQQ